MLIDRHGPHAALVASDTAGEAEEQGDTPKRDAWRAILRAVETLQATSDGKPPH